ncbi:MAG: helix-turn-helix transcriptional regulator [Caulobacterales bacterium]|nr:helix-turn-helix transcriptional regulator [Caulobacterales bacterium]
MADWVSSTIHRDLVTALVLARHAEGLTQRDLAQKLGKPQSYVGKVESIERNLSVSEFWFWAGAVGLDPGGLLNQVGGK